MWLITTIGFFSIVQKPGQQATGTLTVRGRVRADLEALRDRHLPSMGPIEADGGTDYKYRAVAPAAAVAAAMCAAVAEIDYPNFKSAVAARQGSARAGLYHKLWDTLYKLTGVDQAKPAAAAPSGGAGNRFVDTEEDLPCWGIPVPDDAKRPVAGGTGGPNPDGWATATAFGGVVFDGGGRVLLRKPAGEFDGYAWTFPKGRPKAGEPAERAAVREVREETGVRATIVVKIPGTYRGGTSHTSYYRMTPVQDVGDFDRAETERVVWVEPAEARRLIAQTRNEVGRRRDLDVLAAALTVGRG